MPSKIEPRNPSDKEQLLIGTLIEAAEAKQQKKIHKYISDDIELKCGLRRSTDGKKWWGVEEIVGFGSNHTKVKLVPYYYEKDQDTGKYQIHEPEDIHIFKILKASYECRWDKLMEIAFQEYERLKLVDKNVELFIEPENNRIYLMSTLAKGVSLDKYLSNHPDLTLTERLHLIDLIKNKIRYLHDDIKIAHVDLKLENIYCDEESDTITIIDYGSSQLIDAVLPADKPYLHLTSTLFDPHNHDQNTPQQIDYYSAAGVFGLILSDWSNIGETWNEKPIMSIKVKYAVMGKYIVTQDMSKRCYAFDELMNVSYISSNKDKKDMAYIINALKKLGHEDEKMRGDLTQFESDLNQLPSKQSSTQLSTQSSTPKLNMNSAKLFSSPQMINKRDQLTPYIPLRKSTG